MKQLHNWHLLTITGVIVAASLLGSAAYQLLTPPPKPLVSNDNAPQEQKDTKFPSPVSVQPTEKVLGTTTDLPLAVKLEATTSAAIFQEANTSSTMVATASADLTYIVIGKSPGWFQILVDGKQGFVEESKVKEQSF